MLKPVALSFVVSLLAVTVLSAGKERAWQTGTWHDVQVARPKIVFGVTGRPLDGRPSPPFPPAMMEVRTYVIETDALRIELRESTRADSPRIDATVGEPVTFALEKNTVYIKLGDRDEHKLSVTKRMIKARS
jgi:hypothetical protein